MKMKLSPRLLYADEKGRIYDHPELLALGETNDTLFPLGSADLIDVPQGSELFTLPGRLPVGLNPVTGKNVILKEDPLHPGHPVSAVSAFLSPAYTRILNPAYAITPKSVHLPLFAYTAVGFANGNFVAPAWRVDPDQRQDFRHFENKDYKKAVVEALDELPGNKLVEQLSTCVLEYGCAAAKNYVLHRWECPLPTSPACNAECLGCVSSQPSGCCPAPQRRLQAPPGAKDVADVAVLHISRAKRPVVSFGQGCEGEPLLKFDVLEKSIGLIRESTKKGTINLNTNASLPGKVRALAEAGLDAMRVTMISARRKVYNAYHKPRGYTLDDVFESIRIAASAGVHVSLNLLTFPGLTDSTIELDKLRALLDKGWIKGIQLRNLNIDPELLKAELGRFLPPGKPGGMKKIAGKLKRSYPGLWLGYYNPYLGE
ncbi:MAG: radical SAM protein [Deltaproteobacteria bacterium]|nr:radical SAM protein [Deltaproteobacteria bacterium]